MAGQCQEFRYVSARLEPMDTLSKQFVLPTTGMLGISSASFVDGAFRGFLYLGGTLVCS